MSTDERLNFLIEKAAAIAGSEYKLAKLLGLPPQTLTGWKAGRRTCTPGDRARLAGLAHEDALQELARATIDAAKGTKREQLQRVLGKRLRQTGEALHSVAVALLSLTFGMTYFDLPRCILC